MTPRPPTPMSQMREQSLNTHIQSPPMSDIRNSSPRCSDHTSTQPTELPQCVSPANPTSPPRQPVFSPVTEHTPMSEMRENPVQESDTPEQPIKLPTPTSSPSPAAKSPRRSSRICAAPQRRGYDSSQGFGNLASPSAWIFEENGIVLSPTVFKTEASDPDTLTFSKLLWLILNM